MPLRCAIFFMAYLLLSPLSHCQQPNPQVDCAAEPTFEVTSIHLGSDNGSWSIHFTADEFQAKNEDLMSVIRFAYGLHDDEVVGGAGWLKTTKFDISARIDDQLQACFGKLMEYELVIARRRMLQRLLADRFHLRTQFQKRSIATFVLSVSEEGSKMRDMGVPTNRAEPKGSAQSPQFNLRGVGEIEARSAPMWLLVNAISAELGSTVLDQTGLNGEYTYMLRWKSDTGGAMNALFHGAYRGNIESDDADREPPLPTALREQLGLYIVRRKIVRDCLTIESVLLPSEN